MTETQSPHTRPKPWTVYGSINENLPESYYTGAARLGDLAAAHGVDLFCGSQRGLLGSLVEAFMDTRARLDSRRDPPRVRPRITSLPYKVYFNPEQDKAYDAVEVQDTLLAQQQALAAAGQHLIALPGGIGTRAEIWSTIEELRCNPSNEGKHLWLLNIAHAFDALRADIMATLDDRTTREQDFSRVHMVDDAEQLAACVIHGTQVYPVFIKRG